MLINIIDDDDDNEEEEEVNSLEQSSSSNQDTDCTNSVLFDAAWQKIAFEATISYEEV